MSYQEIVDATVRMIVLHLLKEDPGYDCNEIMLHDMVNDGYGVQVSRDKLAGQLAWLDEQGLITLRQVDMLGRTVGLARLTPRGLDVAMGRVSVPGVKRPGPEGI